MIIKREEQTLETKVRMREGSGSVLLRELLPPERFCGHGRLFSTLTLEPGCSIGKHRHEGESETFYVLRGTALFDDDGVQTTLRAGDVAHTASGREHALANAGEDTLEVVALIVYD